ncbi:MAG: PKD domain-containing protein [Bacteroidota bacterium]
MKFKIAILLISIILLKTEVYADGCNNGSFWIIQNCDFPLRICVSPLGVSDELEHTDYTWDFGDGTTLSYSNITSLLDTVCHNYAVAGTYTVTLTLVVHQLFNTKTCVPTHQVTVSDLSYKVVESFDCNTNTGSLTLSYTGGNAIWDWDPDTLNAAVYPNWPNGTVINNPDVNTTIPTSLGEQHAILIKSGNCFYLDKFTITGFDLTAVYTDISCYNANDGTATATVNGGTAPYTYTWSNGTVETIPGTSSTVSNLAAGTYTVQVTDSTGCTATQMVTIVNPPIVIIDAGPDITICSATIGNIGATTTAGYTYSWAPITGLSDTTVSNPSVTLTNGGVVPVITSYTVTTTVGSCIVTDEVNVTVDPLPSVNAGPDQTICSGTVSLAGSVAGAAVGCTWSGGSGIFSPNNTTLTSNYLPSASEITAGTITLTLTTDDPPGSCASANDQVVITINPLVLVDAGIDQVICIGNSATLSCVATGPASSGTWTGGAGTYSPDNTASNAVYTATSAEAIAGTVTLTYTTDDPPGACTAVNDQMLITINQLPTANAGSTQSLCPGIGITLSGSIGGTATGGTWSGGTGTYSPNNTTLNAIYSPSVAEYAADSVKLTLTTNDPAGPCSFSTSEVVFHFYKNPVVDFSVNDPEGCPIHCVDFTDLTVVDGGSTIASWNWNFGDGSIGLSSQSPSHCYSQTGFYDVTLTATSSNNCVTTLIIPQMIHVFQQPDAEFNPTPNPATVVDPLIVFNNQSSSDVSYWNWNFGDGDSLVPGNSDPEHTYPNASSSSYLATLIVHNPDGCYDTIAHEIFIGPEYTFFIPNSFTPNADGVNDHFFGSGTGIIEYDLLIFDRWGNMIFHGEELNEKWDGKANKGKEVAQIDVYVWKVELTDVFNEKHNFIGTVTLVK